MPDPMTLRLVSLVPAATEWLDAFGAAGLVCGVDARHERVEAPAVAAPGFAVGRVSSALTVCAPRTRDPERDLLEGPFRRAAPDLVVYDALEEAWPDGLAERLSALAGKPVDLFPWTPRSLREVFEHVLRLGRRIDRLAGAMKTLGDGELRLRISHARTGVNRRAAPETLPGVVVLTDAAPLTVGGRWMSELVDRAAGHALLTSSSSAARVVSRAEIEEAKAALVIHVGPGPFEPVVGARNLTYPGVDRLEGAGPGLYDAIVDFTDLVYPRHGPPASS